jgi:oxygen-independent coproporphyrinogen-3 oxidase
MSSNDGKKDISWVYGNDTEDVLGNMFDKKIGAHVETPGKMVPPPMKDETWENLMKSDDDGRNRSAYINIPFCQTKCLYCGFFKNWSNPEKETEYVDLLVKEMEMDSKSNFRRSHPFNAVYIGGGTPSTLSKENIEKLLAGINDNLFLANDCELTFESRLYQMDDDKVEACLEGGINRFSFGVQSFNTKVRKAIGRVLERKKVIDRLNYVKDSSRATVVIDLMYGLSYQTNETWENDIQTYIDMELDGCDLYQLIVFQESDLEKKVADKSIGRTASVREQSRMFQFGVEMMEENGQRRLSNCHFSKGYRERSMYNSMTLSNSIVVPFGSGSGGNIGDHRLFLDPRLDEYSRTVKLGKKPIMGLIQNSSFQSFYRDISGGMNEGRLDLKVLGQRYGLEHVTSLLELINVWKEKGLLTMKKHSLELTIAGQFWSVNLSQALIDWHQKSLKGEEKSTNHSGGSGHPASIPKNPENMSMGSHPKGIPKSHPADIPLGNRISEGSIDVKRGPGGIPSSKPSEGSGHPAWIPKGHPKHIKIEKSGTEKDESKKKVKGDGEK